MNIYRILFQLEWLSYDCLLDHFVTPINVATSDEWCKVNKDVLGDLIAICRLKGLNIGSVLFPLIMRKSIPCILERVKFVVFFVNVV